MLPVAYMPRIVRMQLGSCQSDGKYLPESDTVSGPVTSTAES